MDDVIVKMLVSCTNAVKILNGSDGFSLSQCVW